LSFGKGLAFFAPGLLIPLEKTDERLPPRLWECYRGWMLFLAGMVLVYAKWWAWYGGLTWGPRFFLMASFPASLALAVSLRRTPRFDWKWIAVLGVLALSLWVGIDGAVFDQANMGVCQQNDWAQEFLCWYTPEFSALWRPFVAPSPVSPSAMLIIAFCVVATASVISSTFNVQSPTAPPRS